jgi:hypothetical protein
MGFGPSFAADQVTRTAQLVRVASQNLHIKLRDIARDVVKTGALPDLRR